MLSGGLALPLVMMASAMVLSEPKITFPANSDVAGRYVLQPTAASLLLALKSLETMPQENAVVSPVNLYTCLWLLYEGTRGDTKNELEQVLGLPGNETITSQLRNMVDVHAANAAFLDMSVTVKYDYVLAGDRDVFSLNFAGDEDTQLVINKWVSDQTKGSIPSLLESRPDASTKAVIISALYFNGSWLYPFDPQFTKISKFESSPDAPAEEVHMMSRYAQFLHYKGPSYEAVGVPYRDNGFTLFVFLPRSSGARALRNLLRHLTPDEVNRAASSAAETPLILSMPKFSVDHTTMLRPVLQSLGVNKIFDPQFADFGDLVDSNTGSNVFVSDVIQSVHLEVDEKGTRGGAATAAILTKSGKNTFVVNRPFVYLLRHNSGHVLFFGVFSHP